MFKNVRIVLFILAVLLLNANFLLARPAFAEEGANNATVVLRDTKASNPKCQMSQAIAIISGIGAALVTLVSGAMLYSGVITIPIGTALLIGGIASIVGIVMGSAMFFGCNFSFVRHPVLRSDINDGSSGNPGTYRQCRNPMPDYPSCANGVFKNEDEYFKCIGDEDIEKGRKDEPRCLDKEFEQASEYYWPKNRVSSSNYIEVCYRLPLGLGLFVPVLAAYITDTDLIKGGPDDFFTKSNKAVHEDDTDSHDPREADYGGDVIKRMKAYIRGPIKCSGPLRAGEKATIYEMTFKAVDRGDKLCVDTWGLGDQSMFPQQEVGCHMRPSGPPAPMCEKSVAVIENGKVVRYNNDQCFNWYISPACHSITGAHTKSPFPLTSVVVECIRESLDNLLTGKDNDGRKREDGFLGVAQKRLKTAVKAALILALMLFAIKAALGGVQHTAEVYMLVIKFALVMYFTVGPGMSDYYGKLIQLSTGLSDIVLQAGGNATVCNYRPDEYPTIRGKNLGYLAVWDRLDCRVMFYLGSQLNVTTGATMFFSLLAASLIPFALLFGLQILICIAALFMVIMLVLVAVWMVYLFILSLIALTIITLISPLFIPMSLFQATKGFFDGWLKEIMTYSLYPVILFAFLSLMFSVFDNLYFGKLQFRRVEFGGGSIGNITIAPKTSFVLNPDNACALAENKNNLACIMNTMALKNHTILFGIEITGFEFDKGLTIAIWTKLGMMALMGFLFYHFLGTIGSLAAELAGNPRANLSGGVTSPTAMMKKGLSAAMSAHSAASSAVRAAGRKIAGGSEDKGDKKAGEEVTKG